MQIRYNITKSDLIAAANMRLGWLRMALITSGVFFVLMMLTTMHDRPPIPFSTYAGLQALGAIAFGFSMSVGSMFILIPLQMARVHSQNPTSYRDLELTADTDGFTIKGPRGLSQFPWSEVKGFKEGKGLIVIVKSKTLFFAVPKRDLSTDDVSAFRLLLVEHVALLK